MLVDSVRLQVPVIDTGAISANKLRLGRILKHQQPLWIPLQPTPYRDDGSTIVVIFGVP
jgi:hypothetical protein